jgi:ATP-dependent Lhr-like helicase
MQSFQFHPIIARWFEQKFGSPTEPQARGWPAIQAGAHTLIAAPTGSGKTLAAFLAALDNLFQQGLAGTLRDETQIVYVSPLKALSNDIHKNLEEPLTEIREALLSIGAPRVDVRAAVRTGDTPASKRQAIARKPPHILVTTPESLYLLLTSLSGRKLLSTVRTVIVDEIHAVVANRRGSHLALSLERLANLVKSPLQRIGLSATQKPIETVAEFLLGGSLNRGNSLHPSSGPASQQHLLPASNKSACEGKPPAGCTIVDCGYSREMDLSIEIPGSPLEAVMSNEVWTEVYHRLAELIEAHRTTLVFVNTRRMAERVTHQLCERLGHDSVTSHHGSLSAKLRLEAEGRLKRGELKALVATASLELGIDIGSVDLVCQLGPTRSLATLLQRIGRARHQRGGIPKGRLFPLSRDELVECAAMLRSVRHGELDRLVVPQKPLDVLAQQIVACVATDDWDEERLFELTRSAWPYRNLTREEFEEVIRMLAEGFSTKRGRRAALVHHDTVNHRIRGRRGAGLVALTSGGAIPDTADYRVVLEPAETFIGTVNEDFAVESLAGDIFQLGNASWRILRINSGTVRVEDAHGQPPNMPFWLGEAPGRTDELSRAVSDLRSDIEHKLMEARRALTLPNAPQGTSSILASRDEGPLSKGSFLETPPNQASPMNSARANGQNSIPPDLSSIIGLLMAETALSEPAARQIADYFSGTFQALGVIPSQQKLVMERFFDESGGMQLVIHSPFGIRVNRAWGLALRKRFCRSFNFELQAAASDDSIVLSLGTQHSFPLEEVFRYLHSKSVRDVLVQALLDAPMFPVRWRWNATRALALPRQRGGRKIPAPLQRMESENLLAAVFPDQLACLENIVGDREVPDHPLVRQTIDDCLTEAMDIDGLITLLRKIETQVVECIARDLPEPSPLAHEILNARPYAFLDNAPLEERRTQAVYTRRAGDRSNSDGLGILDPAAIETVCADAWPRATNPDELHEALLLAGLLSEEELRRTTYPRNGDTGARPSEEWRSWLAALVADKRVTRLRSNWLAVERLPQVQVIYPETPVAPILEVPESTRTRHWERADAIRELVRGRMEISGPLTIPALSEFLDLPPSEVEPALIALESEGFVLRGRFRPTATEQEWCDRRLLARIHRLTINRLRAEIQPVSLAELQRFLLAWQRVNLDHQVQGPEGVAAVLDLLDGYQLPAGAWEPEVLAARVKDYQPEWLDRLCFTGRIGWGRLTPPQQQNNRMSGPIRSSPISLFSRDKLRLWLALSPPPAPPQFSPDTSRVLEALSQNGAMFFGELLAKVGNLLPSRVEQALGELSAYGWVTSDSFEGLRALLLPQEKRLPLSSSPRRSRFRAVSSVEFAGRWTLLQAPPSTDRTTPEGQNGHTISNEIRDRAIEAFAHALLRRYGVMFRRLLEREALNVSWYELTRVYRAMESRGEIRGGHFVSGVSGEQFALPEAISQLRTIRKQPTQGRWVTLSGADPLNLSGILVPGPRVSAAGSNRLLLQDGLTIATLEAGQVIKAQPDTPEADRLIERALRVGSMPVPLRPYYG